MNDQSPMTPANHATDCDFHFEQYPHECNCGLIVDRSGTGGVIVPRQLFRAMVATLQRKQHVFDHYANLHADKGTEDGERKALANRTHATDIARVVGQTKVPYDVSIPTPALNLLDLHYSMVRKTGREPVAFIMTPDMSKQVLREIRAVYALQFVETHADYGASYRGCEIMIVEEQQWHTALICACEDSPILHAARARRDRGDVPR
ncbi:hypothetical protein vBCbaSRXM_55 [Citromicrobium phage vB_CbaS-RXM]|nr:hypothetical protein vBCbaSRXM_55 [Citromicrobium phage vB_CbaS-RXM]